MFWVEQYRIIYMKHIEGDILTVFKAIQSVFSILIMISIGYFLTYKGWFNDDSSKLLSKIVTYVSLPPLMIYNLTESFDRHSLLSSFNGLAVPFLSIGICYVISKFVSKLIKVKKERRGLFETMFFASNTIFIGLPVNIAIFGSKSLPYALLYYMANTFLFWTIGIYDIRKYSEGTKEKLFSLNSIKKVFSPPFIGFILGTSIVLLGINLPDFVMDTCKYLGNLTTPLSMIFIGITMYSVKLKDIKPSIDMAAILIGRFLIAPLTIVALTPIFPMPELMKNVFITQSAMPAITQAAIISKAYGSDYKYTSVIVTVTTILSLVFIPVYVLLMK